MEFLPRDSHGLPPSIDFRTIDEDLWMGFNFSCDLIPLEASDYVSAQTHATRAAKMKATGPTGTYLEMEWALDTDWFDPEAGWRPYLPRAREDSIEWFFQFDQGTPINIDSSTGGYTIAPSSIERMSLDLRRLEECVLAIAKSSAFPRGGIRPGNYHYEALHSTFGSEEDVEDFGANVRRQALDYLGFIAWWTTSFSRWDTVLPQSVVSAIDDLNLAQYQKRGVLINLERDWRHVSLPHLIRQRIPTFIRWREILDTEERFLSVSPRFLRAFEAVRSSSMDGLVLRDDMPEFFTDFETMQNYDEFFQCRVFDSTVSPELQFLEDWTYAVVDFQGWMYRTIPLATAKEFAKRFGSHFVMRGSHKSIIFRRWEVLNLRDSNAIEEGDELVRGQIEIREIHRSFYAPVDRQKFDDNGYPDYGVRANSANAVIHRPNSWVEAMAGSTHSSSRSSSSGGDRERTNSRNSNRSHPYSRPRSRSSLPQEQHPDQSDTSDVELGQLIFRLQAIASIIGPPTPWPTCAISQWNTDFLSEGVILFPDNRTQIHLRYWATCNRSVRSVAEVIEFAIERSMRFIIAIPLAALPRFQLSEPPSMMDLTKRTYDTGFQESQLTYMKGRAAFMDQYLGKLADILHRPHARAVVAMGGPTSWIARHSGGDRLVTEFMAGPSIQVTVHHRGGVNTGTMHNMPVFYDQLSAQEIELIHGYIPLGSPTEVRWAYPTSELLEEFSKHWRGEWNAGCERIMSNISLSLASGLLAPMTRKEWREYLRGNNRGEYAPSPGSIPTSEDFTAAENEIDAVFPLRWHGRHLRDISLPEESVFTVSGN